MSTLKSKINKENNTTGERLRYIRKLSDISQVEFANSVGISQGHLSSLESDKEKVTETIAIAIEYRYSISGDWLLTGEGLQEKQDHHISEAAGIYAAKSPEEGFTLVPKYDIEASAGGGRVIHSEQVVDHLTFKTSWIRGVLGLDPKNLILISAVGDSMEPTIRAGDLLLLDRAVESIVDDALYSILINDVLLIKRIQRLFDASVLVKSDNPAYQTQTLSKTQAEDLQVIGRLVWVGRRV